MISNIKWKFPEILYFLASVKFQHDFIILMWNSSKNLNLKPIPHTIQHIKTISHLFCDRNNFYSVHMPFKTASPINLLFIKFWKLHYINTDSVILILIFSCNYFTFGTTYLILYAHDHAIKQKDWISFHNCYSWPIDNQLNISFDELMLANLLRAARRNENFDNWKFL